ncbi:thioredoxin domain-containing protein [Arcobacter sp. LA11]|uniref:DsbA family protein n=1 Tax=Arcobacter sp. LA11 TaxID=1898176 RepID=UPI0009343CDF|nr:thioredoxin domain-containing protein [Arcobacter sp. LA11]
MLSVTKVLMIGTLLISTSIYANSVDDKVIKFEKDRFSKNKRIEIKDISVNTKKELHIKGWSGFIIDVNAVMAGNPIKVKDIVFSNGDVIAPELYDVNTGDSLKDLMTPKLDTKYHDKNKLIAGSADAKDKIVIFSDPLCPFCMDYVPDVINHVNKNSKDIALYYYHFPLLQLHPAAKTLVRLMNAAKAEGIKDIELKVYKADWDKYFSEKEKNTQKIIDGFNKEFNTSITFMDINNKKMTDEILHDVSMGEEAMVQGTPTIFINGEKDKSKLKYETLGK